MKFTSRLIGKAGMKIALIRKNTGADITIRQGRPEDEFSKVVVVGTARSVAAAEAAIWETLGMEAGSNIKEFEIPAEFVSAIIGPGGSYIKQMREQAGGVQIGVRIPDPPETGVHKVMIGPAVPEKLEFAAKLVSDRIAAYRQECLATLSAPGSSKLKAIPCKFNMAGTCKKGELCPFSHDDLADWPMDPDNRADSLARLNASGAGHLRSIPCKFFAEGKCRKGETCSFSHAKAEDWPELAEGSNPGATSWQSGSNKGVAGWATGSNTGTSDWQAGSNAGASDWSARSNSGAPGWQLS